MRLAIPLALFLAATASRDGCGNGPRPYEPCAGKPCGEACTACAPDATDCAETAVVKACDPSGRCVPKVEGLCAAVRDPCAGKACGAGCTIDPPCLDAVPPCMMPSVLGHCDPGGACVPGGPPPPGFCPPPPPSWGCAGKACGDSCGYCPPDADPASCPVPTFAPTACDARLQCVTAGTFTCPPPTDPCLGQPCGTACDPCGGMCMHPYASACDRAGRCVPATDWLCYDPCAGKACKDPCTVCPPDATNCYETAVLKACDADGRCVTDTPLLACPP